jgi:hypothetical protein
VFYSFIQYRASMYSIYDYSTKSSDFSTEAFNSRCTMPTDPVAMQLRHLLAQDELIVSVIPWSIVSPKIGMAQNWATSLCPRNGP